MDGHFTKAFFSQIKNIDLTPNTGSAASIRLSHNSILLHPRSLEPLPGSHVGGSYLSFLTLLF